MMYLILISVFIFSIKGFANNSTAPTQNELDKVISSLSETTKKLQNSKMNFIELNKSIQQELDKIQSFDVNKWAGVFFDSVSVMTIEEAEKKFEKPANDIEKILAAFRISTQNVLNKDKNNPVLQKTVLYLEKDVISKVKLFIKSLTAQDRSYVVKDNPLAFGNEPDIFLEEKIDDSPCTKVHFEKSLNGYLTKNKRKDLTLFMMPYAHYQNRYFLAYLKRLFDLSQKWKHENAKIVQNYFSAQIIQANSIKLKEKSAELLKNHEIGIRKALDRELSSHQIEALERDIVSKLPSCYGNGFSQTQQSKKVLAFIRGK